MLFPSQRPGRMSEGRCPDAISIEMSRQIIEPLALSRRYFRSRWALLRGLIRLFLPFRSDGQDQPTQKRPFVFVFVSNKWRSQRRWYRHDRLSTRRVIDEPPPTAES